MIFLKDTRGFIEENLDPDDSYVHDKTYTNMAPFVTISPYVSDSAFVWNSDTIFKMQNVLLDLRHILFISVRRVYLIGIGSGAHAALKWSLQYPLMFAAIVLVSPHFVDGAVAQSDAECSPDDVQDRSTTVLDDETEAGFNENHVKITTTTPSWRVWLFLFAFQFGLVYCHWYTSIPVGYVVCSLMILVYLPDITGMYVCRRNEANNHYFARR